MIQCPVCRVSYVNNTLFCTECGLYLLERDDIGTDPFETSEVNWRGDRKLGRQRKSDLPGSGPLTLILHIGLPGRDLPDPAPLPNPSHPGPPNGAEAGFPASGGTQSAGSHSPPEKETVGAARNGRGKPTMLAGELEVPLARPIRLGRMDPNQNIYPEVDLTDYRAMEHGVSREHACIFRRGNVIEVEDLSSTNGTLLNGKRLAPYLPVPLSHGDQLQLGKLLIEVGLRGSAPRPFSSQDPAGQVPGRMGSEGRHEPDSPVEEDAFQATAV
jgi:hypothetical protein